MSSGSSSGLANTNLATQSVVITGGVYNLAAANAIATPVSLGNVRVGGSFGTQSLTISNTAPAGAYTEGLNASFGTSSGAASNNSGSFSNLSGGSSNSSSLAVGLGGGANTATAGLVTGTQAITLVSSGSSSGLADTNLATQNVVITGGVYNYANAVYSGTTFAFGTLHQGATAPASRTVAFGNQTVTNPSYQDTLNVSGSTGNSRVTATGFTGLAASTGGSATNNLTIGVSTSTAGSLASAVSLSLVSNANGVAGLSDGTATVVGSPGAITTTGQVYSGQATWATDGGGSWGTLASGFGANWGAFQGSPGLDPSFADTDTATFGGALTTGTGTVSLDGASPSLKGITFDNANASYRLVQGSGGAITLLGSGTPATMSVLSGSHEIDVALTFASDVAVDVASGAELRLIKGLGGTGSFSMNGLGTLILTASSSFAGDMVINSGYVGIRNSFAFGPGVVTLNSGTIDLNFTDIGNVLKTYGGVVINARPNSNTEKEVYGDTTFETTDGGSTGGVITVENTGSATFNSTVTASVTVSGQGAATFNDELKSTGSVAVTTGGAATFNSTVSGSVAVDGNATFDGVVAAGAAVSIGSTGTAQLSNNAVLNQSSLTNDGTIVVDRNANSPLVIATSINGSGSLQKVGDGVLTLTGSSTLTGGIDIQQGGVVINGAVADADVNVAAGAALGGSGFVGGALSGDGSIGPGNSPGILTAAALDPGALMSFAFEMTKMGDPTWSAVNSGNDVLRLTDLSSPFVSSLVSTNVVDVYFNVGSFSIGDTFSGAFFTDKSQDFLVSIEAAKFNYFLVGDAGEVSYNGKNYYAINPAWVTVSTQQVASANFASGTVVDGYATNFIVVPEPGSMTLAALGIATAAWTLRRRLRGKAA